MGNVELYHLPWLQLPCVLSNVHRLLSERRSSTAVQVVALLLPPHWQQIPSDAANPAELLDLHLQGATGAYCQYHCLHVGWRNYCWPHIHQLHPGPGIHPSTGVWVCCLALGLPSGELLPSENAGKMTNCITSCCTTRSSSLAHTFFLHGCLACSISSCHAGPVLVYVMLSFSRQSF